ncbi:MAG: hypothetical protein ACKVX9_03570 [Blastocatellia bacterium]
MIIGGLVSATALTSIVLLALYLVFEGNREPVSQPLSSTRGAGDPALIEQSA